METQPATKGWCATPCSISVWHPRPLPSPSPSPSQPQARLNQHLLQVRRPHLLASPARIHHQPPFLHLDHQHLTEW